MPKKRKRPRGSSNAGRPRQDGPRYADGRLRPPGPNEAVLADRRYLVGDDGDLTKASHPLDLAYARGWITERHHRAGSTYASLYAQARLCAPGGYGTASIASSDPAAETRTGQLRDLSPSEMGAVWDNVFSVRASVDQDTQAEAAMKLWKRASGVMTPAQQAEVFLVCVRASWPQWIIQRAAGHFETRWEDRFVLLTRGLERIATQLRPTKAGAKPPPIEPEPPPVHRPAPGPRPEEVTSYVDREGAVLFEVFRKGRKPR